MNIDRIAGSYRWLEYLAFGRQLERSRDYFLTSVARAKHALVIGDGDGRFTRALLASNPSVTVDSVELSLAMITLAKRRIDASGLGDRIRFINSDALNVDLPRRSYDLIVTHFVLDCFSTNDAGALIDHVSKAASSDSLWLITEFAVPSGFWRKVHATLWIRSMYAFFAIATGLEAKRVPDYAPYLLCSGYRLTASNEARWGLISSELWQRTES